MQLIEANTASFEGPDVLTVANDSAIEDLRLDGITTVLLHFPKFNDGRAFSQAFELRRRRGFEGRVIATGRPDEIKSNAEVKKAYLGDVYNRSQASNQLSHLASAVKDGGHSAGQIKDELKNRTVSLSFDGSYQPANRGTWNEISLLQLPKLQSESTLEKKMLFCSALPALENQRLQRG